MKVLIVDDNITKAGKLANVLRNEGLSANDVEVVPCATAARARLRDEQFDLLVIDLLLPLRVGDDPKPESAFALIEEIAERSVLKKPRVIVGFTAFPEAATIASPLFKESMWTIVNYDETLNSWVKQFQNVTRYLASCIAQDEPAQYTVDVCLITALSIEMDAFLLLPWEWEEPEPMDDQTFIRRGKITINGQTFTVVSAICARMGCVASALLVSKLISRFRPRFVVMGGICAGVEGKVGIGDAVFFDPVWEWPSGKLSVNEAGSYLQAAPHQIAVSDFLSARAAQVSEHKTLGPAMYAEWGGKKPAASPKFVVGPGASGSAVVADDRTIDAIRLQHRKLTAVEMEAYGVFAAAKSCSSPKPSAFVVKSVCDFADEAKGEEWQKYASFTSARFLSHFLERFLPEMTGLCGT